MQSQEIDALLERHRERFRRFVSELVDDDRHPDPFRVSFDAFAAAADSERIELVRRAARVGRHRVEQALADLRATWIVLIGDEVVTSSRDRETMPTPEEVVALGRTRGLAPYLFEAPLIEEVASRSDWAPTSTGIRDNLYPTVPLRMLARDLVADLDTGSHGTLIDDEIAHDRDGSHVWFSGSHLGHSFRWRPGRVSVEVGLEGGERRTVDLPIRWVADWASSAFVRINPARRALAGRDLLRAVGATVVLRPSAADTRLVP